MGCFFWVFKLTFGKVYLRLLVVGVVGVGIVSGVHYQKTVQMFKSNMKSSYFGRFSRLAGLFGLIGR